MSNDAQTPSLPLPALHPNIEIYKGADTDEGSPSWVIHHPVSNKYYRIEWAEFECLARFHRFDNGDDLIEAVNAETTLEIDADDLKKLLLFLYQNGLVSGKDAIAPASNAQKKERSIWMVLLHNYLFFTLPLFHPQAFLDKAYPYIKPLLSKGFLSASYALLIGMILITLQRSYEFLHTFFRFFSLEGVMWIAILFMGIKILHEFGHAFTARKYNVPVPHMGVALIVLYPVLYTETTGVWRLPSQKQRVHIGLAGIATELVIAAFALLLWNILPPGLGQSLAFGVVAISLIGSLLINLNPLMRFDGYYVLSDALGIDNLQSRSIPFARWKIRRTLFGLLDEMPEDVSAQKQRILIGYGLALLVYRFFLFTGIAFLVYHVFFQPLGAFLMAIELGFFIILPIFKELSVWYERRNDLFTYKRGKIFGAACLVAFILFVLPIQSHISAPAIIHAKRYDSVHAPVAARISEINIQQGDTVHKGDILVKLRSAKLERDIEMAMLELNTLEHLKQRDQTDATLFNSRRGTIDTEIEGAREQLDSLKRRKDQMTIKADFDGMILDMDPSLFVGAYINPSQLLFRLIADESDTITAYVSEEQLDRIKRGNTGVFKTDFHLFSRQVVHVTKIDRVNIKSLGWPELSSFYAGPFASEYTHDERGRGEIIPRQSLYEVTLSPDNNHKKNLSEQSLVQRGRVRIEASTTSPALVFFKRLTALILRETGLN